MDLLNKKKKSLLKQVATDNLYQSTFLPIFDDAQKRIKELIITYYWLGLPLTTLRQKIKAIIIAVKGKIPKDLHDREAYVNGLIKNTNELLNIYFVRATAYFKKAKEIYENTLDTKQVSVKLANMKIKSPKDLAEAIKLAPKHQKDIWASQKGAVRLPQYDKKIKEYINQISDLEITTSEKGKKSISLWQKAELDVRHEKQMKMIDDLKNENVDLCWISTHPDCSKRCEKWQGKLVSLTLPSTMTGFRVKKVDGNWVYSLKEIMAQKDKYGYENNIINGFNCRHHLTPYTPNSNAPTEYTAEEIKKQRQIETNIRAKEREIRHLKTKLKGYTIISEIDKNNARKLKALIKSKIADYKKYCDDNGYAWYEYRIGYDTL